MTEQRKSPRKIANEILEVFDQITGAQLGKVVNISAEGLMLLSSEQISIGSVYQLDLKLPRLIKKHSRISFGAEAVWATEAAQPNSYWTGFRMIDISEENILTIDELIFDWHILDQRFLRSSVAPKLRTKLLSYRNAAETLNECLLSTPVKTWGDELLAIMTTAPILPQIITAFAAGAPRIRISVISSVPGGFYRLRAHYPTKPSLWLNRTDNPVVCRVGRESCKCCE